MALDGFTIHALVAELRPIIVNTRVDRIHQSAPEEIAIQLRGARDSYTLIISAHAQLARFQLGERPFVPQNPPPFAMLLRKHLAGARLTNLQQFGLERVIRFEFDTYEEYAGQAARSLYLEIMGRHSNLILADQEDIILGAAKHVNEQQSRVRQVLPGEKYTFPPSQHKKDPRAMSVEDLSLMIGRSDPAKKVREILVKHLDGISPLLADELLARSGYAAAITAGDFGDSATDRLWAVLAELVDKTRTGLWEPGVAIDESGHVTDFSCIKPTHLADGRITVRDLALNQCVTESFEKTAANNRLAVLKQNLFRIITQAMTRAQHRQKAHHEAIAAADEADKWRIYGELLLTCAGAKAGPGAAPKADADTGSNGKGQSVVTLINYYDPSCAQISIPLDPALTVANNAQKYFKKYTKIKRGLKYASQQLEKADQEISYLESVLTALEFADQPSEIEEIRLELQQSGYQKVGARGNGKGHDKGKEKGRRNAPEKAGFHKFKSSQGIEIIVGKNNVQNDRLTTEMAAPNDLWLHVQKAPGSHVLIRSGSSGGNQVDDITLLEAANLAVFFSKMRTSSKVSVDYTNKKHVKKPPGFRPGMVIYDNFSTIIVDPDPAILKHFGLVAE